MNHRCCIFFNFGVFYFVGINTHQRCSLSHFLLLMRSTLMYNSQMMVVEFLWITNWSTSHCGRMGESWKVKHNISSQNSSRNAVNVWYFQEYLTSLLSAAHGIGCCFTELCPCPPQHLQTTYRWWQRTLQPHSVDTKPKISLSSALQREENQPHRWVVVKDTLSCLSTGDMS